MKMNLGFLFFIGMFLALYGSLHYYFYRKVTKAFHLAFVPHMILVIILCLLLFSPIIMRMLENAGPEALSTAVTYTGYIWMGIVFMLFALNLVVDICSLIIYISSRIFNTSLTNLIPDKKTVIIAVSLFAVCINIYGLFEAWNIKTERIVIDTDKLPEEIKTFRIVQISDVHFSRMNGVKLANKITEIVMDLEPDLFVSTGDLIDDGLREADKVQVLFRSIKTGYGKYAVTGNHEFYGGLKKNIKFTEGCGFTMLRNRYVKVNNYIGLAGVDDPAANREGLVKSINESSVIEQFSPDTLNIFLKHQPVVEKINTGEFDIQLSGHTHRGQIFPFTLMVGAVFKYISGKYYLGGDTFLYVSRGTGTWGPPIRFLSPPEVTVIDFVNEKSRKNKVRKRING